MATPTFLKFHQADSLGTSPDLDGVTAPGLYQYIASSVVYYLLVYKQANGDVMQVRITASDGAADTRVRASGTWGSWVTKLKATNLVIAGTIPTANPNVAGQVYSNSGVLTISAG